MLLANILPGRISSFLNVLAPGVTVEDATYSSGDDLELPLRIYHPHSISKASALILFQGASPSGEKHEVINRLARGLAKVGFRVFIPRLPRLKEILIRVETIERIIEVFQQVQERRDIFADRITVIGFSFSGSLLVKACLDRRMNGLPARVLCYGSYFDLERTLEFVLTGEYGYGERQYRLEPHEWGSTVFFHNYLEELDGDFNIDALRNYFLSLIEEDSKKAENYALLSKKEKDFIDLINHDREESLRMARAVIPRLRPIIETLSPRYFIQEINFPVYLVHGAKDNMIPFTETMAFSEALEQQGKEVNTFISRLYTHSELEAGSRGIFSLMGELWRLGRFLNDFLFF
ncbi:MAG: hypothetical protein ACE5EE_07125 [Fidelibacterota bacterium]